MADQFSVTPRKSSMTSRYHACYPAWYAHGVKNGLLFLRPVFPVGREDLRCNVRVCFVPGRGRVGEKAVHDEDVVASLIGGPGFRDVVEDVAEFDQEGIRVHGCEFFDHVAYFSLLLFPRIVIGEGVDDVCDGMAEVLREGFIGDAAVFHRVVEVSGGNEFRPVRALRNKSSHPFHVDVVGGTREFSGLSFMNFLCESSRKVYKMITRKFHNL